MKLGFILFDYFPFGGLQRDCLKTSKRCAARGHDVTILTRTWQGEQPGEVQIHLFGRHGFTNEGRNNYFLKELIRFIAKEKFHGVIGFNKVPGLDVYYGSDPCYVAKVERIKPFWYKWLPRYHHFKRLERSVFEKGLKTEILLLTPNEIEAYRRYYGTEIERFHLLPPGIEKRTWSEQPSAQARQEVRRSFGWAATDKLILFVGSGFRVKGLERAIKSLSALPPPLRRQTRLVVVGQNKPGRFGTLAQKTGVTDRVHFLGGRNDVYHFLLGSDLLLHPAHSESAGMVLLEALTAGLPVIATDVCGYAFHIEKSGAGRVLASPFSQEELNRTVEEFLAEPRSTWRSNGLRYAAAEDLYSCSERAADIIEETIQRKIQRSHGLA